MKSIKFLLTLVVTALAMAVFTPGTVSYAAKKASFETRVLNASSHYYRDRLAGSEAALYDSFEKVCHKLMSDSIKGVSVDFAVENSQGRDWVRTDYVSMQGLSVNRCFDIHRLFLAEHPQYYFLNNYYYTDNESLYALCVYDDFQKSEDFDKATKEFIAGVKKTYRYCVNSTNGIIDAEPNELIAKSKEYKKYLFAGEANLWLECFTKYQRGELDQSSYDTFVNRSGVCASSAEAYELLCNLKGIPSMCVVSNGVGKYQSHEWNQIYIGGKWTSVDSSMGAELGTVCFGFSDNYENEFKFVDEKTNNYFKKTHIAGRLCSSYRPKTQAVLEDELIASITGENK